MGQRSTVSKANSKSPSVRITIPEKVVEQFGFKVGDVLEWDTFLLDGKRVLRVRKMEAT